MKTIAIGCSLAADTERYRQEMVAHGMQQWTPRRLLEELDALGYKIDRAGSFSYNSYGNEIPFAARSLRIAEKDTGIGFANIKANGLNIRELQEIRRNTFVFYRGRLWHY